MDRLRRWNRISRLVGLVTLAWVVFFAALNLLIYWRAGHHWVSLAGGLFCLLMIPVQIRQVRSATRRLRDRPIEYDWRELE